MLVKYGQERFIFLWLPRVDFPYKNTAHMCMQFAHMLHACYSYINHVFHTYAGTLKFDHVRTMCASCIQSKITVPMCSLHACSILSSEPYMYAAHMHYVNSRPFLHIMLHMCSG